MMLFFLDDFLKRLPTGILGSNDFITRVAKDIFFIFELFILLS